MLLGAPIPLVYPRREVRLSHLQRPPVWDSQTVSTFLENDLAVVVSATHLEEIRISSTMFITKVPPLLEVMAESSTTLVLSLLALGPANTSFHDCPLILLGTC